MKRTGSPYHSPPEVYKCYNNVQCSRAINPYIEPPVRPVIPTRGYWISRTPPHPVEYGAVFVEPPSSHNKPWFPSPYEYNTPRMLLPPPPPPPPPPPSPSPPPPPPLPSAFYSPHVYHQSYSPPPHYPRNNRDIDMEKRPVMSTPTSNYFNDGFSTSYNLNPSESPMKQKPLPKSSKEELFLSPKHKKFNRKFKPVRTNLVDRVELNIQEENDNYRHRNTSSNEFHPEENVNYRYNKLNNEIHPEILATWRKNLKKSKESSSTLKIEICLKKKDRIRIETTKQNLNIEGKKTVQKVSNQKTNQSSHQSSTASNTKKSSPKSRRLCNKMSSSNSSDNAKSCIKDGLSTSPVSSLKDKKHSISDEKKSPLRFTPSQIHKVHKRRKCDSPPSSLERRSYNIPMEALEKSEPRHKHDESKIKNRTTSDRDRTSDFCRKSSLSRLESPRSSHKPGQDTDSGLETYRSRNSRSPTPTNDRSTVSSKKLSSNSKSHSSIQKSEHNSESDSDIGETPNSSVYVTPEGTPSSAKSKETKERQYVRFKRSLSDDYNDEGHSANSSLNSSGYYTPESSPSKFNSAKRQKTRWSDSSSFSLDYSSSSLSWRHKTDSSDQGIQPELIGYQMVGDSQFCRFGQQLLGLERVPMPNSSGRIGICVSGQTITDLHRRVKDNFYPISDKIILMIGTNDFLRNVNVTMMCEELSALIKTLQKSASNIILLTLPPIPKLEKKNSMTHFKLLDIFNSHIRSLENGEKLRIADISPMYMTSPPYQRCRMHLFEVFFNGPAKRLDLIHLNRCGLDLIRKCSLLFIQRKFTVLVIETEEQLAEEVEKEVRDYAIKIGINPDTEKHLLNIALDGLMSPLPEDWKACLDERVNRIYYYNGKTHQTQWSHPLDEHFENLVKKKRQEESISAGDDDSKTSIKEDLKSFEEAVTTSDMMSSRHPASTHKSRLTSPSKQSPPAIKDPSPDGRKVLNPIGRPPLPPKRRAASTSPKRSLSLRLSPSPAPAPGRIDIDSIGVPVGVSSTLPSPEVKGEKQPGARSPGIKLTGGGSAFLKSKQKQSPSPSEETRKLPDESSLKSFEIVREADSIESDDENGMENKDDEDRKLRHSTSLGESGFDKLIKSKKFMSLQESLSSLKNELELPSSEPKSPNISGLRGILRDKPSPTPKLWDVDPALLTSEEKERLRIQEMKDERKQNVRFADIINKPINIEFSKSDSEDDSTTNDSSNDLDDLILENMHSDDELRKENKVLENSLKLDMKLDDNENSKTDQSPESLTKDLSSPGGNKLNRNIISRLSDLGVDSSKKKDVLTRKSGETDNNNKEESDNWLTDTEDIMNQNEKKIQALRKNVYDITKLSWDAENNPVDKHLTEVGFVKAHVKPPSLKQSSQSSSPVKRMQFMEIMNKELVDSYPLPGDKMKKEKSNFMDLKKLSDELNDDNVKTRNVRKSRLMPDVDLQKVFQSVKENIMNSSEHSDNSDVEPMETSPLGPGVEDVQSALEQNEEDLRRIGAGAVYKTDDRTWEKYNRQKDRKFEEYKERQKKIFEEKKALIYHEFEDTMEEIKKELKRQESIECQRIHMEVQQSMIRYKEEVEAEKNERDAEIRNQCEDYLKELEAMLSKDKEMKIKKMKEEHEMFLKDQETRLNEEKAHFEEEKKIRLHTSSSQLEKIVAELKEKEEKDILQLKEISDKKLEDVRKQIEQDQLEQEKKHKQELAIVEAEYERVLGDRRRAVEQLISQQEAELVTTRAQHQAAVDQLTEQHRVILRQLQEQAREEEEFLKKKHAEKMEALNAQLSRTSEKEDITQLNREFEKVRCEKRLLEDKYKSLKDKYVRLKSEVRLSMERKRQAKLNRQLQQQRDPASTTEDTSADHGKPPLARKKLIPTLSSDEGTGDNANGTPKTIKRRPKATTSMTASSTTAEQSSSSVPLHKPKNVWNPSPHQRREGVSSAEDNHTSVSEEIQLEQENFVGDKWTQSALSPLENLRKQLEKLDDLEEQFPTSVHTDTYLRYPFSGPAGGSCELDFYRHRLHLERESVRRAKQALAEQRVNIEARQLQLRHKQHTQTFNTLHQEERELTDMEVSLHRTRALLGEKIIRLRYLEQSIERAAAFTPHHSHSQDSTTATNTDSSGFSGSDLDLSNAGLGGGARSEMFWTENVIQSLENINSEIREIWAILGKQQQVPGLGPPPVLNYESRAIAGADSYNGLAPHRATDIADRTRRLKEWLVRTREQQTHVIAPVTL